MIKTIQKAAHFNGKVEQTQQKIVKTSKGLVYRCCVLSSNTSKVIGASILSDLTLVVSFLTGCTTMEARPGIQWPDSQKPASKWKRLCLMREDSSTTLATNHRGKKNLLWIFKRVETLDRCADIRSKE